jgi:deoxyribodipyrimidine photo-lyase
MRPPLQIVWFKRDLRVEDHAPLAAAVDSGLPTLLLYVVEPEQRTDPHLSLRHWRFIWQSLLDIDGRLEPFGHHLHVVEGRLPQLFEQLSQRFRILALHSHEEIGTESSFAGTDRWRSGAAHAVSAGSSSPAAPSYAAPATDTIGTVTGNR